MNRINIQWEGPFKWDVALGMNDLKTDHGLYQIYGTHPVYGSDKLLYIGKAAKQTFAQRLGQEFWDWNSAGKANLEVHLGRLIGPDNPDTCRLEQMIDEVEKLLIVANWPACNSSRLNVVIESGLCDCHVMNWGAFRDILPEVTGLRYSKYPEIDSYKPYSI